MPAETMPVNPNPQVKGIDVIMPAHGRLDLTMRSVDCLYRNTRVPFHLVVVDDSTDLTPLYFEGLKKERPNITYIHSDVPYKSGNQFFNKALEHCTNDYVATVMNSIFVEPEWEIVALNLMEKDPKVGVIGFKCLFSFPNTHVGLIESAGIDMRGCTPIDIGRDYPGHALSFIKECKAVQWAFALLRREAVVGNLAEDVFYGFRGYDDIDNCFVLKSKGWKVYYCGLGVGYHEPRATRGDNSEVAYKENKANAIAFCKRWGFWEEYKKIHKIGDEAPILYHPNRPKRTYQKVAVMAK